MEIIPGSAGAVHHPQAYHLQYYSHEVHERYTSAKPSCMLMKHQQEARSTHQSRLQSGCLAVAPNAYTLLEFRHGLLEESVMDDETHSVQSQSACLLPARQARCDYADNVRKRRRRKVSNKVQSKSKGLMKQTLDATLKSDYTQKKN